MLKYILCAAAALILAGLFTFLTKALFERVPESWLSDYDEEFTGNSGEDRISKRALPVIFTTFALSSFFSFMQYLQYGIKGAVLIACVGLIVYFLVMTYISDLKYTIIPDQFVVAIAVLAIMVIILDLPLGLKLFHSNWLSVLWGALIGFGVFFIIGAIGSLITKKNAFGFGDIKLLTALGLFSGTEGIIIILIISVLIATIHFVALMLMGKLKRGEYKPFGPYICIATIVYISFRSYIVMGVDWYLSLLMGR